MSQVLVIGAGVVGAAAACELSRRGASVTVLDRGEPGGGTSGATFAVDITARKTPREYFDLSLQSGRRHAQLAAELAGDEFCPSWVHPAPWIEVGDNDHDREVMASRRARLATWGYRSEVARTSELGDLARGLDLSPVEGETATIYPDAAWYTPSIFIDRMLQAACSELHSGVTVTGLTRRGDRGWTVHAGADRWHADWVINCAGPEADVIARMAGTDLPLMRLPGLIGYSEPLQAVRPKAVLTLGDVDLRPSIDGGLCLHSFPIDAHLNTASDNNVPAPRNPSDKLRRRVARFVPALRNPAGTSFSTRVGVRPVPADGLPLIGMWPEVPRLYTIATHSGIHLAPILAQLAAEEITTGGEMAALWPYRPHRAAAEPADESYREMARTYAASDN